MQNLGQGKPGKVLNAETKMPQTNRHVDSSGSDSIGEYSQDYLYSSYLRSMNLRTMFFGGEIVGCLIDIHYPESAGRFICEVVDYKPQMGWHKVSSVNVHMDHRPKSAAINYESNTTEEDFTDEVDLNAFFRERRIQFIGKDDSPYLYCSVCKWQAAPRVACIPCSECGHLVHTRCAARSAGIEFDDVTNADQLIEEYTCAHCNRSANRSPQLSNLVDPHHSVPGSPSSPPLSPSSGSYDDISGWHTDEIVLALNSEFWDLQTNGRRKFKFISGVEYLNNLCNGSINHALMALQHCSTAGVLSWVYEDGSESENCKILRRGLDSSDHSVQLLVCIADMSPTNQPRLSSKAPSQAWCCHMTFGFIAFSGLLKSARTRDSLRKQYGQILVFACRSSHARSINELYSVITERVWSNWTVLDTHDGQLIDTVEQVATHSSLEYTVKAAAPPACPTPEDLHMAPPPVRSGRRGMALQSEEGKSKETRQVLGEIFVPGGIRTRNGQVTTSVDKVIKRSEWDPTRFALVHRGLNYEAAYLPSLPTPSRLIFGACLRLFQQLHYRVVLLELALPITDCLRRHGQGREIEVVTSHGFQCLSRPGRPVERDSLTPWPAWMPHEGELCLAPTSNASAYKTYRAFGMGEHCVWNALGCNASSNYRYPVMGCVLEQDKAGGVSAADLHAISVRKTSFRGIDSWISTLKKRHNKSSHEPSVVARLLEGGGFHLDDPDTRDWMHHLHLFEEVLDQIRSNKLGVADFPPSAKKQRIIKR